jgi:membrane protein YqaA with SNARE-associated domain
MSIILKILTVAGLATFEIYAAIPAGFAFKLSPWVIFLASLTGGISGVFIAAFLGDKIKTFIAKFKKPAAPKPVKKDSFILKIWNKYGTIGLGAIGTFFVGAPVCIALGVGLNANLSKLIFWCCIGVAVRCVVFTLAGHYGMKLF